MKASTLLFALLPALTMAVCRGGGKRNGASCSGSNIDDMACGDHVVVSFSDTLAMHGTSPASLIGPSNHFASYNATAPCQEVAHIGVRFSPVALSTDTVKTAVVSIDWKVGGKEGLQVLL
jgi:hypothetical protein